MGPLQLIGSTTAIPCSTLAEVHRLIAEGPLRFLVRWCATRSTERQQPDNL